MAARWKTAAAPCVARSTTCGSRMLPTISSAPGPPRLSRDPDDRLSRTRTVQPRSSSSRTRCDPMNPAPPVTSAVGISDPAQSEDRAGRAEQNPHVHQQAAMLDVVQVVFELLGRALDRSALAVVHLRPAADAGLDQQPRAVERDLLLQLGHQLGPFRPR